MTIRELKDLIEDAQLSDDTEIVIDTTNEHKIERYGLRYYCDKEKTKKIYLGW